MAIGAPVVVAAPRGSAHAAATAPKACSSSRRELLRPRDEPLGRLDQRLAPQ